MRAYAGLFFVNTASEHEAARGMVRTKISFLSHLKRLSYSLAAFLLL
jgi:hypothetical protein